MPMLSDLLRYKIVDDQLHAARLDDLIVNVIDETYPPVTYLVYRGPLPQRELMVLNWKAVQSIDDQAQKIRVDDLGRGRAPERDWLEKAVLLKRDMMDALMLDLHERAPVLANDLWLEAEGSQLRLYAVDISFRAVMRRLTGGFSIFRHIRRRRGDRPHRSQHDWKYIEFLRGDPEAPDHGLSYHGLISRLPHGEIAFLADLLPYLYSAELLCILPDNTAANTLEIMIPTRQLQAFKELGQEKSLKLLVLMRPDIVADLIARLKPMEARYWLERMPREQADRIIDLLHYPADTAGGIMTNDFVSLPADTRVSEATEQLIEQLKRTAFINFIQFVYVVDSEDRQQLQGFLSLRDLLVAGEDKTLSDVMDPYIIPLTPFEKSMDAARRVIESGITALPVVDPNGRLLGIVTIDTALGLMVPRTETREVLRLSS